MHPLGYVDVRELLARLGDLGPSVVLVGGQAVNFWADYYAPRAPELAEAAPFTSKDIDFAGSRRVVAQVARRLAGRAVLPSMDDATPSSGAVLYTDAQGMARQLDVITAPLGLKETDVHRTAIPVPLLDAAGRDTTSRFLVLHPVLMMFSRAANVIRLPGDYDTPLGRKQLRASIVCAGEFLADLLAQPDLDEKTRARAVLRWYGRIHAFACRTVTGRAALGRGYDLVAPVRPDARLPSKFNEREYPKIRERADELIHRSVARAAGRRSPA